MRIITTPNISNGGFEPSYKVYCKYTLFYDSIQYKKPEKRINKPHSDFVPTFKKEKVAKKGSITESDSICDNNQVLVYDDVKIEFFHGQH